MKLQEDSMQLFRNRVAWFANIHAWRGSTMESTHSVDLSIKSNAFVGIHTTPAMYLALSLMRSARRIAGADGPVSNSGRP
ncbi:hypothetical protein [Stenotrophomonas sepilia]|jgi:hypothetical protein|uniref:hypothetical protein n=1 Tax=Stenotrophomonas sepilia TaxID=2860290 RepID=UPI002E7842A1|nr:hypothetical protein [Stenotrophomonas sepilia]